MWWINQLNLQLFTCFSGITEIIPAGTESKYLIQLGKIKFSTKTEKQVSLKLGFYLHKKKQFRAGLFLSSPMQYWRLQRGFFSHPPVKTSEFCHPAFLNFDSFAPTLWWTCWLRFTHLLSYKCFWLSGGQAVDVCCNYCCFDCIHWEKRWGPWEAPAWRRAGQETAGNFLRCPNQPDCDKWHKVARVPPPVAGNSVRLTASTGLFCPSFFSVNWPCMYW